MKFLFLSVVAIVLTTQVFACNYGRMCRTPDYARLTTPRQVLDIPDAHGICIAPNGDFAVTSYNTDTKIYLYHACGTLMKVVDLRNHVNPRLYSCDCAFTENKLYITSPGNNRVYELSSNGEFIRSFVSSFNFFRIAICQNRVYLTTSTSDGKFYIYDNNGKLLRSHSLPGRTRGVVVGMDDKVYVSIWNKVYTYTLDGNLIGSKDMVADDLGMDKAGHLIATDGKSSVVVYSSSGEVIKTINTGKSDGRTSDVEIGNDGTVLVADYTSSKVYMY